RASRRPPAPAARRTGPPPGHPGGPPRGTGRPGNAPSARTTPVLPPPALRGCWSAQGCPSARSCSGRSGSVPRRVDVRGEGGLGGGEDRVERSHVVDREVSEDATVDL